MPPLLYWVGRLGRRVAPSALIHTMLDTGIGLRPGPETSDPAATVSMYADTAARHGVELRGARVLMFGYGGGFGAALEMLERGVDRLVLQDPYAPYRSARNRHLPAARMEPDFRRVRGRWAPAGDRVEITRAQLPDVARTRPSSLDLIVSSSVLEHVADVEPQVAAMRGLLRPGGLAIHRIDLRDHFFRYPFEMLCYSEPVWRRWLNASNNLNRWRAWHYDDAFKRHFESVDLDVVESLPGELAATRSRVRPEFLSGRPEFDAASIIVVEAVAGRHGDASPGPGLPPPAGRVR